MGAVRKSAFAGRVPDALPSLDLCALCHPVSGFHMHIDHRPAGLFVPIAIQILDHDPIRARVINPSATAVTHSSEGTQPRASPGGAKSSAAQAAPSPQPPCGPLVKDHTFSVSKGNCMGAGRDRVAATARRSNRTDIQKDRSRLDPILPRLTARFQASSPARRLMAS